MAARGSSGTGDGLNTLLLMGVAYLGMKAVGVVEAFTPDDETEVDAGDATDVPDQEPTLTALQILAMCTAIQWAIHGLTENEGEVVRQLEKCNNDRDVFDLVKAYGRRRPSMLPSSPLDLTATVSQYLSTSDIAEVNDNYRSKGITFQW